MKLVRDPNTEGTRQAFFAVEDIRPEDVAEPSEHLRRALAEILGRKPTNEELAQLRAAAHRP